MGQLAPGKLALTSSTQWHFAHVRMTVRLSGILRTMQNGQAAQMVSRACFVAALTR